LALNPLPRAAVLFFDLLKYFFSGAFESYEKVMLRILVKRSALELAAVREEVHFKVMGLFVNLGPVLVFLPNVCT
jgi:hypothetical protein